MMTDHDDDQRPKSRSAGRNGHSTGNRNSNSKSNGRSNGSGSRNGAGRKLTAVRVAALAAEQLAEITGKTPEGITEFTRADGGWTVTVEVVELERIPRSTDVLGRYEVVLDGDGDLVEYRRVNRYVRSQPGDD